MNKMSDFDIIQETATGKAWYFRGATLPDGCTYSPRPDVDHISGWWKPATQMPIVESCVGENEGKIRCMRFSRVVGYWSAVDDWNEGKKQEWKERKTYGVPSVPRLKAMA